MSIHPHQLSLSVSGSGGTGAVTVGLILLDAVAKAGFYGVMTRSFGPQIRGGESAVMLHFSDQPIETSAEFSQIHLALDWLNFERFHNEIPLNQHSLVIYDNSREKPPGLVEKSGAKQIGLPLQQEVRQLKGSRVNMFALGVLAQQIGLDEHYIEQALQKTLGKKGQEVVDASMQAVKVGMTLIDSAPSVTLDDWQASTHARWNISGNEACGLGAMRGGLKLAAAYPITPATDIVEYLAPRLEKVGGHVLIAEDELAAMNMAIGSSFGGVPSMTSTSGPGFALMTEAMGLAIASETPVLVISVMRGGPSTGIPTKSEQTDLNQVLYGYHGEAPHVVLAPLNVQETTRITQWALGLAEALQTLVVLLTDQRIGQSRVIIDPVPAEDFDLTRRTAQPIEGQSYQRYQLTDDAISPMAIPGIRGGEYAADGLEHTETGKPSSMPLDHEQQMAKRAKKLTDFDYGDDWARVEPADNADSSKLAIITWGSSFEATRTAVQAFNDTNDVQADLIGLRLLMPLPVKQLKKQLKGKKVLVIEQNDTAQLHHYLLSQNAVSKSSQAYAKAGPVLFRPAELQQAIQAFAEKVL